MLLLSIIATAKGNMPLSLKDQKTTKTRLYYDCTKSISQTEKYQNETTMHGETKNGRNTSNLRKKW